jgi:hypothetical protein
MICVVNCYGQHAHAQPLAKAVQTGAVGVVRLMAGERRLTGRGDAQRGGTRRGRGRGRAYTCAVIVYNPRAVTHFIPYYVTRVFARTLSPARTHTHALRITLRPDRRLHILRTPHICAPLRTYRPTVATLAHSTSCRTLRDALHCTCQDCAFLFFFVAIVSACARFALV